MDKFSKQEGSKIAELIEKGREQGFLTYDDVNDSLVNNATNTICPSVKDNFECEGKEIEPGWRVFVGGENYRKLFSSQRIRGPLNVVAKWTFQFALLSVILSFGVGLFLSMILG